MSAERTPAEVVKDLRERADDYYDSEFPDEETIYSEAAALIERLTAVNHPYVPPMADEEDDEPLRMTILRGDDLARSMGGLRSSESARLAAIEAALSDCPTCGGKGTFTTASTRGHYETDELPCPDCHGTGKVSPAQLAALWQAIHEEGTWNDEVRRLYHFDAAFHAAIHLLRAVRPT